MQIRKEIDRHHISIEHELIDTCHTRILRQWSKQRISAHKGSDERM